MVRFVLHKISEKLWAGNSQEEKKRLFEMLLVVLFVQLASIFHLIFNLFNTNANYCLLCDLAMVTVSFLAFAHILNNKPNSVLNTLFTIPLLIYAYNIADFSQHPPLQDTIYNSVWWLLAGAFIFMYFDKSDFKIILYSIISLITIVFQLQKVNGLLNSFSSYEYFFTHPIIIFFLIFSGIFILRHKYKKTITSISDRLKFLNHNVSNVFRNSGFPVAEIKANHDEDGNVVNLRIEKINNAFEAEFGINLYEAKNQEANFIFELIFKDRFDLYKTLFFDNRKAKEFHLKKLERWYKLYTLKPNNNTFYVIFEDTTKIKNKIAELESSKKRYKVLLEAIPDMFFVIGKDGTYEDFVIKESDLFKVKNVNIVGNNIFDVGFPKNMAGKIHQCIQNCLKNNSIETIEYSLKTPNGTYLFEMRLAKLNARSVISVARDITRRKNAEFSLEKAKKKAEESDRLKSAFLINLSHEIRTPLNIITNFTRMLTDSELEKSERTEFSDAITQNGTQLLNMINNTIHLSKIETDTVEISMNFCEINPLLHDIYSQYKPIIPDSREVKMYLEPDVPNSSFGFVTDRRLLKESLHILVDNAVKYTQKGEIHIGYEMLRNEKVKFIVSDTGIGIPPEEKENIFSRFYRVKNHINDITSGSGIGLPIAQHYILLLGGELQLETEPGKGTTIWFSLPFKEGQGYLRVVS